MDFTVTLPIIISFLISVILCPIFIPFLKRLKFGQFVRDEGPQSHLKKSGTPTMGGIVILVSIVITCLIFIKENKDLIPILFATVGFGIIGFLDDYIKVVMKRSLGLKAWQKLIGQFIVTGIFAYYVDQVLNIDKRMIIPFTNGKMLDLGFLWLPMLFFVFLGTTNGSNFTDGLDGLATSVTVLIATFFTVVSLSVYKTITPVTGAVVGSLLGFLVYNSYPAKVFMGDTGSLALGGFVASTAYVLQMPLFIVIVALIYLVEVLSVIIQVSYFKISGGKRIFKMAPIHHHFELCGWPETKVVTIFSIVTAILCFIGLLAL